MIDTFLYDLFLYGPNFLPRRLFALLFFLCFFCSVRGHVPCLGCFVLWLIFRLL